MLAKEFDDKMQGLPDLLPYAAVIPGGVVSEGVRSVIALGKAGQLMATFTYAGRDPETSNQMVLNQAAQRISSACKRMGSGWMAHSVQLCNETGNYAAAELMHFPDPVSRAIDNVRRAKFNSRGRFFAIENYITFTWLPPSLLEAKGKAMLFKTEGSAQKVVSASDFVDQFETELAMLINELKIELSGLRRLGLVRQSDEAGDVWVDEQASFMLRCVTGIRQAVRLSPRTMGLGLDYVLGSQDFVPGARPKVGRKAVRVISIADYPEDVAANMLGILTMIRCEYRLTTRFIFLDKQEALGKVSMVRKRWGQKMYPMMSLITGNRSNVNEDAWQMRSQAQDAERQLTADEVGFGYATQTLVLMDEDEDRLERAMLAVTEALQRKMFVVRVEDVNATEAWLGSLPGEGYADIRRPILDTLDLGAMVPVTAKWPGLMHHPSPMYAALYERGVKPPPLMTVSGAGGSLFNLSMHIDDVGHGMILGPTGAGKSTVMEMMSLSHLRYPRARVIKFEKGYSSFVSCMACGGQYFDFMGEGEAARGLELAPLSRLEGLADMQFAESWLEMVFVLEGLEIESNRRNQIRHILRDLATASPENRSLSDAAIRCQDGEMRQVLEGVIHGPGGAMLNGRRDTVSVDSRFVVFEMEHLMGEGGSTNDRVAIPVLLYLFQLIERLLDGSPVFVPLDEAWMMLKHPLFQAKVQNWLKTWRKRNAQVIFATQELGDLSGSPIFPTIMATCQSRIYLANPDVLSNPDLAQLYRTFGLMPHEVDLIGRSVRKRDYFYASPMGKRLFSMDLSPFELAFVGASSKQDLAQCRQKMEDYGREWISEWLIWRNCSPELLFA